MKQDEGAPKSAGLPVSSSGFRSLGVWERGERIEGLGKRFKIKVTFEGPDRESIKVYALYLGQ